MGPVELKRKNGVGGRGGGRSRNSEAPTGQGLQVGKSHSKNVAILQDHKEKERRTGWSCKGHALDRVPKQEPRPNARKNARKCPDISSLLPLVG